jgi:hypothetical protein
VTPCSPNNRSGYLPAGFGAGRKERCQAMNGAGGTVTLAQRALVETGVLNLWNLPAVCLSALVREFNEHPSFCGVFPKGSVQCS